jgi:hypothetical protein
MVKEICEVKDCENEVLITTHLKENVKVKWCRDCVTDAYKLATNQVFTEGSGDWVTDYEDK